MLANRLICFQKNEKASGRQRVVIERLEGTLAERDDGT